MLTYNQIPENRLDPIYPYSKMDFRGESFLLHPDVLLYNSYKYTSKDVAIYAGLASLRPVAEYLVYGTLTLPLQFCPIKVREHLEDEELLQVKDDKIHFLYEQPPSSLKH